MAITVDGKTELDPEDDAASLNWGSSWRIPTLEQQQELINNCSCQNATLNGVTGQLFTGPNGNSLFLPAAGYRHNSLLHNAGTRGYYWTRTLNSSYPYQAYYLQYGYDGRDHGYSVRAVRDSQN